jgi:hypothetical protein
MAGTYILESRPRTASKADEDDERTNTTIIICPSACERLRETANVLKSGHWYIIHISIPPLPSESCAASLLGVYTVFA